MKAMSKLWTALVVGVTVMAAAIPSWADPVSAPVGEISLSTFNQWIGSSPIHVDTEFPFYDEYYAIGTITSQVYLGVGGVAKGSYVYVYQVHHSNQSPLQAIHYFSFELHGPIQVITDLLVPDPENPRNFIPTFAFQVSEAGGVLSRATHGRIIDGRRGIKFEFGSGGLIRGGTSRRFGFLSSCPPERLRLVTIEYKEFKAIGRWDSIFTPSPEPSVGVMFGLGLLGLPFLRALRRRFMK